MASESPSWSELSKLVAYHILGYIYRNELIPVMNGDSMTYEVRRDHACA